MSHNHSGDCEQTCPHGHDHSPHAQPHISSVWQSCQNGNYERLRAAVDGKNIDVNLKDESGFTPLHYAARNGNVNAVTPFGKDTPLHRAAFMGNYEVVRILVESGALVNAQNIDGQTPLHKSKQSQNREVINYLITKGADPNLLDHKGNPPM